MAKTRGTGLLVLWTDVDPELEAGYNRWYDEEHIPFMLTIPGFLSGGRYRAITGGPKYLALYELEDHHVLRSAAFLDGPRYQPSQRRAGTSGGHIGRDYMIHGYRQIWPTRTQPIEATGPMPPYLTTRRHDVPAALADEVDAWFAAAHAPACLAVPGVLAVRRFAAVEARPSYLTIEEFDRAGVTASDAWRAAQTANPWSARAARFLFDDAGSPGLYERINPPLA